LTSLQKIGFFPLNIAFFLLGPFVLGLLLEGKGYSLLLEPKLE